MMCVRCHQVHICNHHFCYIFFSLSFYSNACCIIITKMWQKKFLHFDIFQPYQTTRCKTNYILIYSAYSSLFFSSSIAACVSFTFSSVVNANGWMAKMNRKEEKEEKHICFDAAEIALSYADAVNIFSLMQWFLQ